MGISGYSQWRKAELLQKCNPSPSLTKTSSNNTVVELRKIASKMQIKGRSKMNKRQLIQAINRNIDKQGSAAIVVDGKMRGIVTSSGSVSRVSPPVPPPPPSVMPRVKASPDEKKALLKNSPALSSNARKGLLSEIQVGVILTKPAKQLSPKERSLKTNLMTQLRAGKQLKHISPVRQTTMKRHYGPPVNDTLKGALMAQLGKGQKLKKTSGPRQWKPKSGLSGARKQVDIMMAKIPSPRTPNFSPNDSGWSPDPYMYSPSPTKTTNLEFKQLTPFSAKRKVKMTPSKKKKLASMQKAQIATFGDMQSALQARRRAFAASPQ